MEPAGIIIITVTLVLCVFAVLSAIVGIVLWYTERTRFLAPIVTFIPTLAMLGAAGGSWGLGILVGMNGPEYYGQACWAWLIGLPAGGVLGGLLALPLVRRFEIKDRPV